MGAKVIEDLADARIIVELHSRLSLSETAKALGIPPATISRRLTRMEQRAGLKLFNRTTRTVTPTDAGLLAFGHANKMLAELEAVEVSLASLRDTVTGPVRITTPTIFGQALLGRVVLDFLASYRDCSIRVDLLDRPVRLSEERYDAAIRIGPIIDDALVARPVGIVRAGLYRRAGLASLSVDALNTAPVGLLHDGDKSPPLLRLASADGSQQFVRIENARLICMNPWLLLETALGSDTVVVLPEIIAAPLLTDGRLERALPGWFAREVPVHLVYERDQKMRPAARAFIETALRLLPLIIAGSAVD